MEISSAVSLVNSIVYKPGWTFEAEDHTNRFEGTVRVRIEYPARNSNREQAANGYTEEIVTYAVFPLVVSECNDESLYFKLLEAIVAIEKHEAREFLRVSPTLWAPFHPHRIDGMRRWHQFTGDPMVSDLQFGIA